MKLPLWDPTGCQSAMGLPQESYWSSHENAKQRHRQGLRQTHCSRCDRWRWPHEQCSDFKHNQQRVKHGQNNIEEFIYSKPTPINLKIADRLKSLYDDALDENEEITRQSICQFTEFFSKNSTAILPKITLAPNGVLRARWIYSDSKFFAVEFTGNTALKLVFQQDSSHSDQSKMNTSEIKISDIITFATEAGFRL